MLIEYAVGDLLPGGPGNYLEARPDREVNRVSKVVRDALILWGDHPDLLEELSVLTHGARLPELVREGLSAREFLQVRVIAHWLYVVL